MSITAEFAQIDAIELDVPSSPGVGASSVVEGFGDFTTIFVTSGGGAFSGKDPSKVDRSAAVLSQARSLSKCRVTT